MQPSDPAFSVIMPTFNRAAILMDAVQSVLSQTYGDFEFIVVDDRSTDDTQTMLAGIDDPRVTVVANKGSKGTSGARNTGIFLARAPWVLQIDSDDIWPNDLLEQFAPVVQHAPTDVAIAYGTLAYIDMTTGALRAVRKASKAGDLHLDLLENHSISHCGSALRTDVLRSIGGYDESFRHQEDSDLLIRITEHHQVLAVPDAVYIVRTGNSDRLMEQNHTAMLALEQLYEKHARELAGNPRARYRQLLNNLDLAVNEADVGRIARLWPRLLPSVWETPDIGLDFVVAQARLARIVMHRLWWGLLNLGRRDRRG